MYKFSNNQLPNCLSQLYVRTDSVHDHNTRDCQLLRVPTGTKTFSKCECLCLERSFQLITFFIRTYRSKLRWYNSEQTYLN